MHSVKSQNSPLSGKTLPFQKWGGSGKAERPRVREILGEATNMELARPLSLEGKESPWRWRGSLGSARRICSGMARTECLSPGSRRPKRVEAAAHRSSTASAVVQVPPPKASPTGHSPQSWTCEAWGKTWASGDGRSRYAERGSREGQAQSRRLGEGVRRGVRICGGQCR